MAVLITNNTLDDDYMLDNTLNHNNNSYISLWRPRPLLPNISGRLPCTIIRTCSGCCVPTPLTWSAVPCRARSKGSRAWSPNARSGTEPSPSLIACKAWMSFSATTTSPKPSVASDRLRPPGCAPVRAHGVEGIQALNQPKGQDYDHPDASQPAMGFAPRRRAVRILARYAEHDDAAPGALPGYCRKHPCVDGTARRERSPAPRPLSRHRAGAARRPGAGT